MYIYIYRERERERERDVRGQKEDVVLIGTVPEGVPGHTIGGG